jgi:hypothetical protein
MNNKTEGRKKYNRLEKVWKQLNIWNVSFTAVILLIVGLALINSLDPETSIRIDFKTVTIVIPGSYFYQAIFNPLWVIAAFFYERNVHHLLNSTVLKVGKIDILTLDAVNNKRETISVTTVNDILSESNQEPHDVRQIISDNELESKIENIDTVVTAAELDLKI